MLTHLSQREGDGIYSIFVVNHCKLLPERWYNFRSPGSLAIERWWHTELSPLVHRCCFILVKYYLLAFRSLILEGIKLLNNPFVLLQKTEKTAGLPWRINKNYALISASALACVSVSLESAGLMLEVLKCPFNSLIPLHIFPVFTAMLLFKRKFTVWAASLCVVIYVREFPVITALILLDIHEWWIAPCWVSRKARGCHKRVHLSYLVYVEEQNFMRNLVIRAFKALSQSLGPVDMGNFAIEKWLLWSQSRFFLRLRIKPCRIPRLRIKSCRILRDFYVDFVGFKCPSEILDIILASVCHWFNNWS